MLLKNSFRVCFKQAVQAQCLIYFIKMVHEVIVSDNLAKVITAAPYHAVVGAGVERHASDAEQCVRRVQKVCYNARAAPRVKAHPVCRAGALSTGTCWDACGCKIIELCAALEIGRASCRER